MDIPQARRIEKPRWINARTILGLLLFTVSLLAGQRLIESTRVTTGMWSAAHDLPTGTVLSANDLVPIQVNLGSQSSHYALAETALIGAVITRPVGAGEMFPLKALAAPGTASDGRLITIPIGPEHAVGGALSPGDLVDVFATFRPGEGGSFSTQLLGEAEVVEVVTSGGIVAAAEGLVGLTLRVTPDDAGRVAFAIRNAEIDVVRVTGGPTGSSRTITSEDFTR